MNVFDRASARIAINSLNKSSNQLDLVTKKVVSMSQTSGVSDTSDSASVSISTRLGGLSLAIEQAIRNLEDGQSTARTPVSSALADINDRERPCVADQRLEREMEKLQEALQEVEDKLADEACTRMTVRMS